MPVEKQRFRLGLATKNEIILVVTDTLEVEEFKTAVVLNVVDSKPSFRKD